MDAVGFLDTLCQGNSLTITDPTVRAAETSRTHNEEMDAV